MTIIERLQVVLQDDNNEVRVLRSDLSALLECVKAQHEWIYIRGHEKPSEWSAMVEAEKKVGLGG